MTGDDQERTPLRIGLTGGIASGKSTAARAFASLGITVVDADRIAREVVEPGQPALERLAAVAGREILDRQGGLDRAALRERMFADEALRAGVESILHPLILDEMRQRLDSAPGPYTVAVIPLLVERQLTHMVDRILVIDSPVATQRERLIRRDGISADSADRILDAQADREQRLAVADDIIVNDSTPEALDAAVHKLDRKYRQLATKAGQRS
ncbi:MAG: dephospho-CoA kinase [Gammaproteobacteria bacterium]|jgi:dephospho-CoA kinase